MPVPDHVDVRPRSTAEILDDSWRLYLSDFLLLLGLSGLFLLPAAAAALWLITQPGADGGFTSWLLPGLAALLLILTGIGSGACQEAFHCWAEEYPPRLGECLAAAGRRGLNHLACQALLLILPLLAVLAMVLPGLHPALRWMMLAVVVVLFVPVWMAGLSRHACLAGGQRNLWRALRQSMRISSRYPLRALLVVATRAALLLLAALNLHLFGRFFLWAAEDLGGFDVAVLRLLFALDNPPYLIALLALATWLLTPYAEAVNYLVFVDARTRYEGLDLGYRVEELFPVSEKKPTDGAEEKKAHGSQPVGFLGVLAVMLCLGLTPAQAGDALSTVKQARQDLAVIQREVREAKPYRDGRRWEEPLRDIGRRLDRGGGYRWYHKAVENFGAKDQKAALDVLERVDGRLALVEESLSRPPQEQALTPEQIKALVSPEARAARKKSGPAREDELKKKDKEPPVKRDDQDRDDFRPGRGGGGPALADGGVAVAAGAAQVLLILLLVVLAVVIVGAVVLLVLSLRRNRVPKPARRQGAIEAVGEEVEDGLEQQDPRNLWGQADELAGRGNFLGAVRLLYLSVLALLHQAGLIRYERTRTNGEYADQLRPRLALHGPFCQLTGVFDLKWYGERTCAEGDYRTCRGLAEEVRHRSAEGEHRNQT